MQGPSAGNADLTPFDTSIRTDLREPLPDAPTRRLVVLSGLASETGSRERNEDYAGTFLGNSGQKSRFGVIAAIADGVGGAKGGRVAAELAVRGTIDAYLSQSEIRGVKRNISTAFDHLNRWIHAIGRTDPALSGMACTLTVLVLRGRQAHVAHVGDTRLYRLRDDRLTQLTEDHTPAAAGLRHVLTRAIGAADSVRVDYDVEEARVHDRYLLCSDGVHGGLSDQRLRGILMARASPDETARQIVDAALAARIGDNATALVLDVPGLPEPNMLDLETAIAALPLPPPPRIGTTIDAYRLEAMLADGQYSRVFRAVDEIAGRNVILKFPKPSVGASAVLRQAFLRETWVAARVRSPWIGEVLEPPPDRRTQLYTVMPCYEGETLERHLRRTPHVRLSSGLDIAIKLAKGVAALHRADIVHRDIKPDNVILETAGGLKLVDLGVARLPLIEDFPTTEAPGTASYMAPELFAGQSGDAQSDLFALGVTIYRMFSGAYPYGEIEPFSRPRFTRATSLLIHRPDLPAWLDQTLTRAFAAPKADRFADVMELVFELEHGAIQAAPASPYSLPLIERYPVRFWQFVAAILAILLLISIQTRG